MDKFEEANPELDWRCVYYKKRCRGCANYFLVGKGASGGYHMLCPKCREIKAPMRYNFRF